MISSRFGRAIELTKMAAKLGLKELSSGDLKSRIEQAQILVESLGKLRGAAMKAGQLLSLELDDYFPPEAIQILSQLQNKVFEAPNMNIAEILKSEFPAEALKDLSQLQLKPFAAASIGQVYLANYKSKPIIIKAQYPDLKKSIASDISVLKNIGSALIFLTNRKMNLEPLWQEISDVLANEIDYLQEAKYLVEFHDKCIQHNWRHLSFRTPELVPSLSSSRVIGQSFETGVTLKEWMDSPQSLARREKMGLAMLELFVTEFFDWGLVQTDPNPSNFLVQENKNLEIVALDFGATKKFDAKFRSDYRKILVATKSKDRAALIEHSMAFDLLDPRESKRAQEVFVDLMAHGMKPLLSAESSSGFDFGSDEFMIENRRISGLLVKELKYSPPPYQLMFLHRKLGGVYSVLKRLKLRVDVSEFWQSLLQVKLI